jgi:ribosomal protein S18 acetylase RimI-like enzyme
MEPVVYEPLTPERLKALKLLNSILFPVKFHDRMYRDALACGAVSRLAFVNGGAAPAGAIMCRLEALPGGQARLYVASLGVLAPYRNSGIGQKLLDLALAECAADPAITTAALHVHVSNDDAVAWYQKRGFAVKVLRLLLCFVLFFGLLAAGGPGVVCRSH